MWYGIMIGMKIHCIGIGGIGLSALARYYVSQGHTVSGSDISPSGLIDTLREEGITVTVPHDASCVSSDVELVVYTIAIREDNVEFVRAKELGVTTKTYAEALGEVTKDKITIAVAGTHGKTTTTAMTYYAMKACGVTPTVIVGSLLKDEHGKQTNFIKGDSDYMVVEACEYKRSFLNLHPTHAIITNIDEDHLDYYKDITDIQSAFQSFADKLPVHGILATHDEVKLSTLCQQVSTLPFITQSVDLSVLGAHNRHNATLVLTLLTALHFDETKIREGLRQFPGTWRRMEYKGKTLHGVPVYDDYGHHPKEIAASLEALTERYPKEEYHSIVLFQPHLYSRTKIFLKDFAEALKGIDEVLILPIYRARLEDTSGINEDIVVDAINQVGGNARTMQSLEDMPAYIESIQASKSVILNIGAGNAFEQLTRITLV